MKGTSNFKDAIKCYLDIKSQEDAQFAIKYAAEGKSIEDCITYILNKVQESGCNGFTDDEVFGMALHYYDEAQIDIGKAIDPQRVVVNYVAELTAEDKEQAKKAAIDKFQAEVITAMKKKAQPKKPAAAPAAAKGKEPLKPVVSQTNLF